MSHEYFDSNYPSTDSLRERAKQRLPGFAFEYLDGGCFSEINLARNTREVREVQLLPWYLRDYQRADLKTVLFGEEYAAPFGIAPVGLQGLIWPRASEILAKAAVEHQVPFILSTVGTASIEEVGKITDGRFWFQLYHPTEDELRDQLLKRAAGAGCQTLVILADTPTFGVRPREIRNGLSIPPRMTWRNLLQMVMHPTWSLSQAVAGMPKFKTMEPYLPPGLNLRHLGLFMNRTFSGRLTQERIRILRDRWKGKLVIKGLVNREDCAAAVALGVDGIIVSNHGGRQIDRGQSTIRPLIDLAREFGHQTQVMMDSGLRSGPDIAAALACGAGFTFLGRAPMYAVGALGSNGGNHVLTLLKRELKQVMEQLGCERISDLTKHLIV